MLSRFAKKMYLKKDLYAVFNNWIFEPLFVTKEEMNRIFGELKNIYLDSPSAFTYEFNWYIWFLLY